LVEMVMHVSTGVEPANLARASDLA